MVVADLVAVDHSTRRSKFTVADRYRTQPWPPQHVHTGRRWCHEKDEWQATLRRRQDHAGMFPGSCCLTRTDGVRRARSWLDAITAADHVGGLLPFPQNTMSFQETAAVAHVGLMADCVYYIGLDATRQAGQVIIAN